MKKITSIILIVVGCITQTVAQPNLRPLPEITTVYPYHVQVGFNTTTVIVFPEPLVTAADKGSQEIIIQQEKSLINVLKIKAAKKDFRPTNIHAYTVDGKLYAFYVTYSLNPDRTTYDLTRVGDLDKNSPQLLLRDKMPKPTFLQEVVLQTRYAKPFFSKRVVDNDMKLQLRTVHVANDWIIMGFELANFSNLDYDIDFTRLYIRDKHRVKRSSIQEQEIIPVYTDDLTRVAGNGKKRFVVIVPKSTIPDRKHFLIEVFEKNGGRRLVLKIKNRHLLKAKSL